MRAPRPLVISHSADSTGAVIALLRIMRWCVQHGVLEPTFIVRDNGALRDEFRRLGPTFVLSQNAEVLLGKASERFPGGRSAVAAARLASTHWLRRLCRKQKIDLIYVNTAMQAPFVASVAPLGLPVVTHIHELETTMRMTVGLGAIKTIIGQSDLLIAASCAVRKMLLLHGAEEARARRRSGARRRIPGSERSRARAAAPRRVESHRWRVRCGGVRVPVIAKGHRYISSGSSARGRERETGNGSRVSMDRRISPETKR